MGNVSSSFFMCPSGFCPLCVVLSVFFSVSFPFEHVARCMYTLSHRPFAGNHVHKRRNDCVFCTISVRIEFVVLSAVVARYMCCCSVPFRIVFVCSLNMLCINWYFAYHRTK